MNGAVPPLGWHNFTCAIPPFSLQQPDAARHRRDVMAYRRHRGFWNAVCKINSLRRPNWFWNCSRTVELAACGQFCCLLTPFPLSSGPVHKYSQVVPPWETPSLTKAVPLGLVILGGDLVTVGTNRSKSR